MRFLRNENGGFTIIELLVVIVIIALLAAISALAYSGVQQRAANTTRVHSAKEYIKLLSMYAIQNGNYPSFTEGACLGIGYTDGTCSNSGLSSSWPAAATVQPAFNTALASVGAIPDYLKLNSTASGQGNEVGAFLYNRGTTNESPSRSFRLVYYLQGNNQDCGVKRILRATDGVTAIGTGAWDAGISTGPTNSNSNSGRTWCIVSLLNPNEF